MKTFNVAKRPEREVLLSDVVERSNFLFKMKLPPGEILEFFQAGKVGTMLIAAYFEILVFHSTKTGPRKPETSERTQKFCTQMSGGHNGLALCFVWDKLHNL